MNSNLSPLSPLRENLGDLCEKTSLRPLRENLCDLCEKTSLRPLRENFGDLCEKASLRPLRENLCDLCEKTSLRPLPENLCDLCEKTSLRPLPENLCDLCEKKNTSAMILAAGHGTRLFPLTSHKPKALVEFDGKTLLAHAINKIIDAGIHHIVINVHHFSDLIIDFINQNKFDATIEISDESEVLLDTAGGLKFAEKHFVDSENILIYNVDIISNINLHHFINQHITNNSLATLAVRNRETSRYFLFDERNLRLCGWRNIKTKEEKICYANDSPIALAFSGIHIVKKEILNLIPNNKKLSFTPLYLELAKDYPINGYLHNEDDWRDMGKIECINLLK